MKGLHAVPKASAKPAGHAIEILITRIWPKKRMSSLKTIYIIQTKEDRVGILVSLNPL
jgi:hypothetical protein